MFESATAEWEWFHDELCLFYPSKCELHSYSPEKSSVQRQILGGGLVPGRGQFKLPIPVSANEVSIKTMMLLGYTGKIEYDSTGCVIARDDKWTGLASREKQKETWQDNRNVIKFCTITSQTCSG